MFGAFWAEFARIQRLVEIGKARDEQLDVLLRSFPSGNENVFDCYDCRRRLKNLYRNLRRKDRNRDALLHRDAAQITPNRYESPLLNVINGELADSVRRAAGGDWHLLRDTLDGNYEVIARKNGVGIGTLKSRVSRSRTKLRSRLLIQRN